MHRNSWSKPFHWQNYRRWKIGLTMVSEFWVTNLYIELHLKKTCMFLFCYLLNTNYFTKPINRHGLFYAAPAKPKVEQFNWIQWGNCVIFMSESKHKQKIIKLSNEKIWNLDFDVFFKSEF